MRLVLRLFVVVVIFSVLTVFTQVGGIIYLVSLLTYILINKKINHRFARFATKSLSFVVLYSIATGLALPIIAKQYGRVHLPVFEKDGLKPRTIWTCILNRHYGTTRLVNTTKGVAINMQKQYPGTVVNYLDSSFPIDWKLPMIPHLSHGDGRKLDVAFHYINKSDGTLSSATPSFSGYGVFEGPREGEVNQQFLCTQKGFWQYDFMPGSENDHEIFLFDEQRTKSLTNYFANDPSIEKIFIEPHLETRLGLTNSKIRFQGCHAARHDDHIHVQVK